MKENEKNMAEQFRGMNGFVYNSLLNHLGVGLNYLGIFAPAAHNPERALVVRNQNLAITPYSPFKPFGK